MLVLIPWEADVRMVLYGQNIYGGICLWILNGRGQVNHAGPSRMKEEGIGKDHHSPQCISREVPAGLMESPQPKVCVSQEWPVPGSRAWPALDGWHGWGVWVGNADRGRSGSRGPQSTIPPTAGDLSFPLHGCHTCVSWKLYRNYI